MKFLFALLALCTAALAADPVPMPDFSAPDINSGSDRRKATSAILSPRNYLNVASAWYFGDET